MTLVPASSEILVSRADDVVRLTLNRPGRGNSLTPGLLDTLSQALDDTAGTARAVVLSGTGPCFSSGGDVAAIRGHDTSAEDLHAYSDALVGGLNRVLLQLRTLPCPVIAAVNGPVTGGSLGLMLAADLSLMARTAFIQPYYAKMGFAPDQALEMGLIDQLAEPENFEQALTDMLTRLEPHDASVIVTSRRLLDAQAGPDGLADRLDAERRAFLIQVARPETRARMDHFLRVSPKSAAVEVHP